MSLHNQSYLVSNHQAELSREAADRRLVSRERQIVVTKPTTEAPVTGTSPRVLHRLLHQLTGAVRPARRYGPS